MTAVADKAWVIGASQGMGAALAARLAASGSQVVVSARGQEDLAAVALRIGACSVPFDATDPSAVKAAVEAVCVTGVPDLVVMNVGDYQPMAATDFDAALCVSLNQTNYLASVYLLESLIPVLRQSGGGQLVLNVSAAAYRGLPNAAAYSAPKAAVLNMAEALAPQLAQENIRLRVINPGFVRSRLTQKNTFPMPLLMDAEAAAERIFDGLSKQGFEIAFPRRLVGFLKLLRCLPTRLYFFFVNKWMLT